jgi:serine/threonine protein kinase
LPAVVRLEEFPVRLIRHKINQMAPDGSAANADNREPAFATRTIGTESDAGTVIGRYHLLQKIGEGGMGEVWLAEQKEPVRRRVAIKLIKAGMDTREVVARFESERQALALMDHPPSLKFSMPVLRRKARRTS